ncbi:secretory phospholipase A2 [Sodiomyces alkalinus F11]|uniref:Secretory phospholipase A2 n=1 Tax=Sodiomyces alkalinus (strain CBS 110278 / VKM F-3762 / F11) TaxID=1314773 RepID=A0A3N2PVT8_SODAK|nr:secretory phospholipase A2 [Sodiomyces alkalinus F11]ROT38592.1 secretory phospholipase A2 [Sodiomyces alkalinus F11]
MKFTASAIALALLPATLASPVEKRQTAVTIVDNYMFSITLPSFSTHHRNRNPSYLIWTTDGCTTSPDNPFGFPFLPACHRHDFGYHNFRAQSRFTSNNKLRIDNKFRDDLYYQCNVNGHGSICRGLAEVYYAAVRAFGGGDATRQTQEEHDALVVLYEEAVRAYEAAVQEAQAKGELPVLE